MTLSYIGIICTLLLSPCWSDPVVPGSLGRPALGAAIDEEWAGPEGFFRTVVQAAAPDGADHYYVDPRPVRLTTGARSPTRSDYLPEDRAIEGVMAMRTEILASLKIEPGDAFSVPDDCPPYEPTADPEGCPDRWIHTVAFDLPVQLDSGHWRIRKLHYVVSPGGIMEHVSDVFLSVEDGCWTVERIEHLMRWG